MLYYSDMVIQQTSFCTFKLKYKSTEITVNPTGKTKEGVVLFTQRDNVYLKYDAEPEVKLVVDSAGEFEVNDIFIFGEKIKKEDTFIYRIGAENLNIGVIAFANQLETLPEDFFQELDILLLNAGGGAMFTPKQAETVYQRYSPKICILFGFNEQAGNKDRVDLLTFEDLQKDLTGIKILEEKSVKFQKEELDRIENTELYYFKNI